MLHDRLDVESLQHASGKVSAFPANHHDRPVRVRAGPGAQDALDHRYAGDGVEGLWQRRLHPGPGAGREHDETDPFVRSPGGFHGVASP
jgi:hypothetical protein